MEKKTSCALTSVLVIAKKEWEVQQEGKREHCREVKDMKRKMEKRKDIHKKQKGRKCLYKIRRKSDETMNVNFTVQVPDCI